MLILLPNDFTGDASFAKKAFSQEVNDAVHSIDCLVVESVKSTFPFLSLFIDKEKARNFETIEHNEHTKNLEKILQQFKNKKKVGLISDAGIACLADPGSEVVALAHKHFIPVRCVGVLSPIIKGLLLSGFSGQRFTFHGYLSRKKECLRKELLRIEKSSALYTQMFIEAPYRVPILFQEILATLSPETFLCVAQNLDMSEEFLQTKSVAKWKNKSVAKGPATFLVAKNMGAQKK